MSSGVLLEEENYVPDVVEDVAEVVHRVHDVVLRVVSVLESYDVIEVSVDVFSGIPTVESDWM